MGVFKLGGLTLKSLFSKRATRKYPYEVREAFENARGQIDMIDIHNCIFCGMCQRKCPADCIVVDRDESRWTYWPYKCIACGACVASCPTKDLEMLRDRPPITTDNQTTRVYELTEEEKAEKARIAAEKKAAALKAAEEKKKAAAAKKAAEEAAGNAPAGE